MNEGINLASLKKSLNILSQIALKQMLELSVSFIQSD